MKLYAIIALIVCVLAPPGQSQTMISKAQQPPATERLGDSVLTVHCETIDTLFADQTNGVYLNNPFPLKVTITNPTDVPYTNLEAAAISFTAGIKVVGSNPDVLGDIAPHASLQVTWQLFAVPHTEATDAQICVFVKADNHVTVDCCSNVHLTAIQLPEIDVTCSIEPSDTLFYNERTGLSGLSELRLKAYIGNHGQQTAYRARGTALLPEYMALEAGEAAIKALDPQDLPPDGSDSLVWKIRPLKIRSGGPDWIEFEVLVASANGEPVRCQTRLYLKAYSRHVLLSFPEYNFVRSGEERNIPIRIEGAAGLQLTRYALRIKYDPGMLRINGVNTDGTLTADGWTEASVSVTGVGTPLTYGDSTVEISAHGNAIDVNDGILLNLRVEGMLKRQHSAGSFGWSVISIDTIQSVLNRGAVSFSTSPGNVIVTDDCLEPLVHAGGSTLKQNRPNPFNPSTVIEYTFQREGVHPPAHL
jgi:hypothetical protein